MPNLLSKNRIWRLNRNFDKEQQAKHQCRCKKSNAKNFKLIPNKNDNQFHMFSMLMKYQIASNMERHFIVTKKRNK